MIPKIIWQTHEWEYNDLPEIFKINTQTWQILNPDWEYKYISGKERRSMVSAIAPELLGMYDSFDSNHRGLVQSDLWRVIAIYHYGGVYTDTDTVCISPLDSMLEIYNDREMIVPTPFGLFDLIPNKTSGPGSHSYIPINIINNKKGYEFRVNNGFFAGKRHNKILKEVIDSLKEKPQIVIDVYNHFCLKYPNLVAYDHRWCHHDNSFKYKGDVPIYN